MQVITLAQVKTYLGITGSTQDAAITAMLPIIDAKVKAITGKAWNYQFIGDITAGSDIMEIYNTKAGSSMRKRPADLSLVSELTTGTQLEGTGLAAGTYIKEVYFDECSTGVDIDGSYGTPFVRLSDKATATKSGQYIYAGISIAYLPLIAKGVQHLINETSTSITDGAWTSRSVGPLSVSRSAADANLEARFGMPAWFIKGLPRFHR